MKTPIEYSILTDWLIRERTGGSEGDCAGKIEFPVHGQRRVLHEKGYSYHKPRDREQLVARNHSEKKAERRGWQARAQLRKR